MFVAVIVVARSIAAHISVLVVPAQRMTDERRHDVDEARGHLVPRVKNHAIAEERHCSEKRAVTQREKRHEQLPIPGKHPHVEQERAIDEVADVDQEVVVVELVVVFLFEGSMLFAIARG